MPPVRPGITSRARGAPQTLRRRPPSAETPLHSLPVPLQPDLGEHVHRLQLLEQQLAGVRYPDGGDRAARLTEVTPARNRSRSNAETDGKLTAIGH